MFSDNSKYAVAFGFVAVMALMVMVVVIGIARMADNYRRMEQIVNEHNVKTNLLNELYATARERSVSLLSMLSITDPFERDDEFLRFEALGTAFAITRTQFDQMALSTIEEGDHKELTGLIVVGVPLQENVLDLLVKDKVNEATQILFHRAIPSQHRVLDHLNEMLSYQQDAARTALGEAKHAYRGTALHIISLALAAFVVGIIIALFVVRRTSRAEDVLFAEATLQSIGDAVITTDAAGRINYLNVTAEELTGWKRHVAKGKPLTDVLRVINEKTQDCIENPVQAALQNNATVRWASHVVLKSTAGRAMAIDMSCSPIRESGNKVVGAVLAFRDVSEERKLRTQLSYQASHDALTGLINRQELEVRLRRVLDSAQHEGTEHALLYLDLDQFKVVNDTCGHIAGDTLVRQLALLLQKEVRASDTLGRFGGDEFGVLLERCTQEQALRVANGLLETIQGFRFLWGDRNLSIGVSIGVVAINESSEGLTGVLSAADAACYAAKDAGRNRIHIFQEDDKRLAQRHGEMQWVSRITKALEEDRFHLYYQPIAPVGAQDPAGGNFEILLRMEDEDGKLVPPNAFIPAAERYNLMTTLDRWVISATFRWLANSAQIMQGLDKCSINLSGHSIGDGQFLAYVSEQLEKVKIDPAKICFEITETAAIANIGNATKFITALKGLGCYFSLDDFGSGLSSFAYLKNLPVDFLKIDGVFVKDMVHSPIDQAMVKSINDIGHVMGKKTIAEFVENDAILERLRHIGVDYAQGYGIAKPEPLENFAIPLSDDVAVG